MEELLKEFAETKDDSERDEWYATDRAVYMTCVCDFAKWLVLNGYKLVKDNGDTSDSVDELIAISRVREETSRQGWG